MNRKKVMAEGWNWYNWFSDDEKFYFTSSNYPKKDLAYLSYPNQGVFTLSLRRQQDNTILTTIEFVSKENPSFNRIVFEGWIHTRLELRKIMRLTGII